MIDSLKVNENFSTSDHNIICWILNTKTDMDDKNVIKYNFRRANYAQITEGLKDIDWEQRFQHLDAEQMWNLFSDILNEAILNFVPKMSSKVKKFPVWMTKDAKKDRNNKLRMWKIYKKHRSYNNRVEYKLALNKATSSYKTAKSEYESKLAKNIKANPKIFIIMLDPKAKEKKRLDT